jgi:hypothetical protein
VFSLDSSCIVTGEGQQRTKSDESLVRDLQSLSVSDLNLDKPSDDSRPHSQRGGKGSEKARRVLVVSIQPCFDKKLEASRKVSRIIYS